MFQYEITFKNDKNIIIDNVDRSIVTNITNSYEKSQEIPQIRKFKENIVPFDKLRFSIFERISSV